MGFQRRLLFCTKNFLTEKSEPLNTSQKIKSFQSRIYSKYINLTPNDMIFNLCRLLKIMRKEIIWMKGLWLVIHMMTKAVTERVRNDFSFYSSIWGMKMYDAYKNWNRVRREKWLIERFIALKLGDLCLVNSSAALVSVYISSCYLGKIFEISSKLFAVISHNFYFSLCCFCHVMLISWLKMSFPFKRSVLLCIDALPKWCEVVVKDQWLCLGNMVFAILFTDDCTLLCVMIS